MLCQCRSWDPKFPNMDNDKPMENISRAKKWTNQPDEKEVIIVFIPP